MVWCYCHLLILMQWSLYFCVSSCLKALPLPPHYPVLKYKICTTSTDRWQNVLLNIVPVQRSGQASSSCQHYKAFKGTYFIRSQDGAAVIVGGRKKCRLRLGKDLIMIISNTGREYKHTETHTYSCFCYLGGQCIELCLFPGY